MAVVVSAFRESTPLAMSLRTRRSAASGLTRTGDVLDRSGEEAGVVVAHAQDFVLLGRWDPQNHLGDPE